MFIRRVLTAFLVMSIAHSARAQSPDPLEDLLSRYRFERDRLLTGIYRASGSELQPGMEVATPFELFSAFSFADSRIRFERTREIPIRSQVDGKKNVREVRQIICLLSDRTLHYSSQLAASPMLSVQNSGVLEVKGSPGTSGYLDPRCLGLIRVDELFKGLKFDEVIARWSLDLSHKKLRVVDEGDGVFKAVSYEGKGRLSIWIDTKQGYALTRVLKEGGVFNKETGEYKTMSQALEEDPEYQKRPSDRRIPLELVIEIPEEIEIGWKEFNSVWVPSSYKHRFSSYDYEKNSTTTGSSLKVVNRELMLNFSWTSVNEPLDSKLFHYEDFALPEGTSVFDFRATKPVLIDIIGAEKKPVTPIVQIPRSSSKFFLTALNVAAIFAALSIWMLRRRFVKK